MSIIRWMTLAAAVALAVTVSACAGGTARPGAPASGSTATASTSPSQSATPQGTVYLSGGFAPARLRLAVGQSFLLVVSPTVETTFPPAGDLLTQRPINAGHYLYTALAPGITTLSAIVRPRCPPGTACPMWIAIAHLMITIHGRG
jgi:hypothetical protein